MPRNMDMSIFGERSMGMKKAERVGYVLSIVLTILYILVSFFSFLLGMLSEVVLDTTNQIFINLINILSCIAMLVPIFCFFWNIVVHKMQKKRLYCLVICSPIPAFNYIWREYTDDIYSRWFNDNIIIFGSNMKRTFFVN